MEKLVGFDHGAAVHGAELTTFALRCRDRGAEFAWLDAPVDVPSPATMADLAALRRQDISAKLAAASVGGEGMPGALSLERRAGLLLLTGVLCKRRAGGRPGCLSHRTLLAVSGGCAHLCLVVTVLSIGVVHQLLASELLLNFFISCCSGTVLFIHVVGMSTSASPQSLGSGLDGWLQSLALLLSQVVVAPFASAAEVIFLAQVLFGVFCSR